MRPCLSSYQSEHDTDLSGALVSTETSTPHLEDWADDPEIMVSQAVALNSKTGTDTLRVLAEDDDADVLRSVARNPICPSDLPERIAAEDGWPSYGVAANPCCPPSVLQETAEAGHSVGAVAERTLNGPTIR